MRSTFLFFILLFCGLTFFPQSDSALFPEDPPDGIFLSYHDFRRNSFISKEQVISDISKDQLEFLGKALSAKTLSYKVGERSATVDCATTWGFFQNKTLYVNFQGDFYRVPVFGSICYLVATITIVNNGFYNPMFGYTGGGMRTQENRQFMINFYDGILTEFSAEKAEALLSRDAELFSEYQQLSRHQRKDQINRYIRRYNTLHPVYFLK